MDDKDKKFPRQKGPRKNGPKPSGPRGRDTAAGNRTRELSDPTAHAEMLAIREACRKLSSERLTGHDLYVTLEPCAMCAGAISFARLRRLYFGAADEKGGAVVNGVRFFASPTCHHVPDIYPGMAESDAALLLKDFFRERREP
jgi:tRNA(Arg) A34 adenosine deaminase TadA